ncbi:MAG: branched-chain amino acid ABC transporter permease [Deltaproteobacteria bacterium]|nr:MAG: branched-chain amino acid ABC transporter permease [Deltaproteobacteria bacterium]
MMKEKLKALSIKSWLGIVFIFLFLFYYPFWVTPYFLHLTVIIIMYAVLSSSWDFLARTGQCSVGQAGFFGIGAYTAALLYIHFKIPPILGMFAGGFLSIFVSIILGYLCLRMRGIYFAISTIAFAEALMVFSLMFRSFTGGAMGLSVPPLFEGNRIPSYFLIFSLLVCVLFFVVWAENSRLHFAFASIRENEDVANILGINPTKYKILAFMVSSFFTGFAGGFYVHYTTFIIPYDVFGLHISIACLIMPILGGLYTILGPVIGTLILMSLTEYLRVTITYGHQIIYGIILVMVVLFLPQGIVGLWKQSVGSVKSLLLNVTSHEVKL